MAVDDEQQRRAHAGRRARWEARANWPLTLAAVLFVIAYAWPILQPDLAPSLEAGCQVVTWATWALFAVDYVARLILSSSRTGFVRSNLPDLAAVALPLLRPLRLLRLVALLSVMNRYAGGTLRGRVAVYVAGSTSLILFVASLAVLDAERHAVGANITTFRDAGSRCWGSSRPRSPPGCSTGSVRSRWRATTPPGPTSRR